MKVHVQFIRGLASNLGLLGCDARHAAEPRHAEARGIRGAERGAGVPGVRGRSLVERFDTGYFGNFQRK